jgi:CRISPR/Cas system-associated exonuclease Cas4 (RecB family)
MIFPDITQAIDDQMFRRQKRYPCHANRASAIGDDCERRLVYERTHWQEKNLPDIGLQYIFEVGNTIEEPVLHMVRQAGFEIYRQQEAFEYKSNGKTLLTGHIDGVLSDGKMEYLAEVKTMSPYVWQAINSADDFNRYSWTRKYKPQLNMYMFGLEIPQGLWLLINKSTGRLKQLNTVLDYELAEWTLKRCERINAHIERNTLPDYLDNADECDKCPFAHVCLPPINRTPIDVETDPEIIEMVARMMELRPANHEYDAINNELKPIMRGREKQLIGDYEYRGKFTADGKQWRGSFRELGK